MTTARLVTLRIAICALGLIGVGGSAATTAEQDTKITAEAMTRQWKDVQSRSPLIAMAYLQSLEALSEDSPAQMATARQTTFEFARRAGVAVASPRICARCELATSEQDVPRYLGCLARRLQCMAPR